MPLQAISDRGDDILKAAREKFEKRSSFPPGLKEQYELQLARMERTENRAAPYTMILTPGFISLPSKFLIFFLRVGKFSSASDPPEQGKKYINITLMTNHPFSRGSIVNILHHFVYHSWT